MHRQGIKPANSLNRKSRRTTHCTCMAPIHSYSLMLIFRHITSTLCHLLYLHFFLNSSQCPLQHKRQISFSFTQQRDNDFTNLANPLSPSLLIQSLISTTSANLSFLCFSTSAASQEYLKVNTHTGSPNAQCGLSHDTRTSPHRNL